jgi:eukaryotic-like serine/threonine-protein kinase
VSLEQISHYRIIDKIGEGGMGEVYRAEDTRLGRPVALKLLPSSYRYDPVRRERFLREARAASALRSPNIATIFDIGEYDDSVFIVMEYVTGELISQKIERGPVSVSEAIETAIQISDALGEAHALGIVHRDIKSSNIMITERGFVKILDFGIATTPESDKDETDETVQIGHPTTPGVVLGTISYMSPEQALARRVDSRSDIFSLGVVMYEMLAARLPFEGDNSIQVIDNIIHVEPVSLLRLNPDIPGELDRIVRKCLRKAADQRYQSARDLMIDLRNVQRRTGGAATTVAIGPAPPGTRRLRSRRSIDSLAILPMVNASGDVEMEYLSDGITESIINNLSQLPRLRVMARSTVFRYKEREAVPQEVGRDLNVRAVLTGRVIQRGDNLVVKAELVDTADGAQLWGDQYNRKLSDIFAVEEEISKEISEKLRLKLNIQQRRRLSKRHTENTAAYQLYLKGRFYLNKRSEDEIKRAIELFHQSIAKDPNYPLPYAGLADAYTLLAAYSGLPPEEAYPIAKAAAMKALKLDESLAEAHTALAAVRCWYEWDYLGAERRYKRALELNPNYATTFLWYSLDLAQMERFDEAIAMVRRAEEIDPLSLIINLNVARILYFARRYDEALEQCNRSIEMGSNFPLAHRRLGQIYAQMGMYSEALAELQKAHALAPADSETMSVMGYAYAASGDISSARALLDEIQEMSRKHYVSPYSLARLHVGLGESDQAFENLEKAFEQRQGILCYLRVEPAFDNIRKDPRFTSLLERLGLLF